MKKLYKTPSVMVFNYQTKHILADSFTAGKGRISGDTTPEGEHLEEIGTGNASDAAVKGMWDY